MASTNKNSFSLLPRDIASTIPLFNSEENNKKEDLLVYAHLFGVIGDWYICQISEDFKTGRNFLKSLNLEERAFQESYREKWSHPKAHEITFDTLPGLPVYMEVDCDTLENLNFLIDLLQLNKTKMRYGAFDRTYNEYYDIDKDIINNHTPSLTFKNIMSELKPKKNKKLLQKLAEIQKDY